MAMMDFLKDELIELKSAREVLDTAISYIVLLDAVNHLVKERKHPILPKVAFGRHPRSQFEGLVYWGIGSDDFWISTHQRIP